MSKQPSVETNTYSLDAELEDGYFSKDATVETVLSGMRHAGYIESMQSKQMLKAGIAQIEGIYATQQAQMRDKLNGLKTFTFEWENGKEFVWKEDVLNILEDSDE